MMKIDREDELGDYYLATLNFFAIVKSKPKDITRKICLIDVIGVDYNIHVDHLWVNNAKRFLSVRRGDSITFTARIDKYTKKSGESFGLRHVRNIIVLNKDN